VPASSEALLKASTGTRPSLQNEVAGQRLAAEIAHGNLRRLASHQPFIT
jgi:hypothetical protein